MLISEPERKKPRSDANAESREVYITGLSKFVAEKDIRRLFGPVSDTFVLSNDLKAHEQSAGQFGDIKRVVLPTDEEDHCKGFAFVEYTEEVHTPARTARDRNQCSLSALSLRPLYDRPSSWMAPS